MRTWRLQFGHFTSISAEALISNKSSEMIFGFTIPLQTGQLIIVMGR